MIFIIVVLLLCLDQLTKFVVTNQLTLHESVPLIKDVFHLTLVYNRGAAFGLLKNQVNLFILTSLVAITLIFLNLNQHKHKKISLYSLALGLILSGAIGNLIDRLFFGYVVDFLDFRIWPVFNLADSAITVGAVLLGYILLTEGKSRKQKAKS